MSVGVITTWKTTLKTTPRIGDKLSLPTLTGMAPFTVTKLEGDSGEVECGNLLGRIKKEDGEWVFNHCLIDKNMTCNVRVVDEEPRSFSITSNIGFHKEYK